MPIMWAGSVSPLPLLVMYDIPTYENTAVLI